MWQLSFMNYHLGYFDLDSYRGEPVENPFGPKLLSMCRHGPKCIWGLFTDLKRGPVDYDSIAQTIESFG